VVPPKVPIGNRQQAIGTLNYDLTILNITAGTFGTIRTVGTFGTIRTGRYLRNNKNRQVPSEQ
jgi:hypothetical protein